MGKTKQGEEKCILTLEIKTKYATHRPAERQGSRRAPLSARWKDSRGLSWLQTEEMDGGWRMDGEERWVEKDGWIKERDEERIARRC